MFVDRRESQFQRTNGANGRGGGKARHYRQAGAINTRKMRDPDNRPEKMGMPKREGEDEKQIGCEKK